MSQEAVQMIDLLRRQAAKYSNVVLYRYLPDDESAPLQLTYADLFSQARSVAALLMKKVPPGERVLLPAPVDLETIVGFFGCLLAGLIAVPVPPPRPFRACQRIRSIIENSRPALVLAPAAIFAKFSERFSESPELVGLPWINVAEAVTHPSDNWADPGSGPRSLAFLQYTSGSTASPKGVMVSHANLLANSALIQHGFGTHEGVRGVSWLPFYHDMGLIGGVLQTLYSGGSITFISPSSFLKHPLRWLSLIAETRAAVNGGPSFAFEHCVRKSTPEQRAKLDLSSWEVAFTGAEPIHSEMIERFSSAFAVSGFRHEAFYPCYGLAEGTLIASGGHRRHAPVILPVAAEPLGARRVRPHPAESEMTRTLVGCGQNLPGQALVIADPDSHGRCAPDHVGEVWVAGPSIAAGYWGNPDATRVTFDAYLADSGEGPFLRTGDLGFLHDGELYIVGRLKDLIIIRGRNYYPPDVERSVEASHPLLRAGSSAAFAVEDENGEQMVIAAEVERSYRDADADNIVVAIRQAVGEHHEIEVAAVVLLKAGTLPRTSSGKIQRGNSRELYLANGWEPLSLWRSLDRSDSSADLHDSDAENIGENRNREAPSASEIESWLIARIANRKHIPATSVDVRAPLVSFGLTSKETVALAAQLQRWLGRPIPATLIYNYPTIEAVANYLAEPNGMIPTQSPSIRNQQHLLDIARLSDVEIEERIRREVSQLNELLSANNASADSLAFNPTRLAALALTEARERLQELRRAQTEPIAIVGIGCRFPGGADTPEAYWRMLLAGTNAVGEVPTYRWDVEKFYDPEPGTVAKSNTRWGAFLPDMDKFDPEFFSISPREAAQIDPQQRLLLEVAWEALEDAGLPPTKLAGSNTGVYVGAISVDWAYLLGRDLVNITGQMGVGAAHSILSNRISYLFDFHGPSMTIDSACSSSLVTVQLAMQALRQKDCDVALAGGVNLMLTPEMTIALSQARMMSPTGSCKAFDAAADGYVRGEGCGMIVLKRLSDAVAAGDRIQGIIRGAAVNQDGRTNGLIAPNGLAQEACIKAALAEAGLTAQQIAYVEAHGTGTAIGDPIEVQALMAALGKDRDAQGPLIVGSVKTNIGHLESAAGIAGLIKTVLALQHGVIPPHLHLKTLNPLMRVEGAPISFPVRPLNWPETEGPRYAGVSSFGFGGTNAHVVLEAPTSVQVTALGKHPERPRHVLTLSARNADSLRLLAKEYADLLAAEPAPNFADVAWSANTGRAQFTHRLAITAQTAAEARELLAGFAEGKESPDVHVGEVFNNNAPPLTFLMTGQGSQYIGMGRTLYQTLPVFREAIDRCDAWLRPDLEKSLVSVLYPNEGESSPIDETAYTQPALFALEYALTEVWRSWGVEPAVVLGHSVGEYAAACAAGVIDPEQGIRLIAQRGRLMQALPAGGVMAAIFASEERVRQSLQSFDGKVSVAAINGPANIVVSGPEALIEQLMASLGTDGIKSQRLVTSHAFHSALLEPMLGELERAASAVTFGKPRCEVISNLTGEAVTDGLLSDPTYWRRHAREPVQFSRSIQGVAERGRSLFLEVGPHPTLLGMARRCLTDHEGQWLPSLRRNTDDWKTILDSLAVLYVHGVTIDWAAFDRDYPRRRVRLPKYPFHRQSYWVGEVGNVPDTLINGIFPEQENSPTVAGGPILHPLLGRRVVSPVAERIFENRLNLRRPAVLADHRVHGTIVVPCADFLETSLAAGSHVGKTPWIVEEFALLEPLVLAGKGDRAFQTIVTPQGEDRASFRIVTQNEDSAADAEANWTTHATGILKAPAAEAAGGKRLFDPMDVLERMTAKPYDAAWRDRVVAAADLTLGASFRWIESNWSENGEALARMRAPTVADKAELFCLHPGLLECCIQLLETTPSDFAPAMGVHVLASVGSVRLFERPTGASWAHAVGRHADTDGIVGDIFLYDEIGRPLLAMKEVRLRRIPRDWLVRLAAGEPPEWVYQLAWPEKPLEPASAENRRQAGGRWLVVADRGGIGAKIARRLELAGAFCHVIGPDDDSVRKAVADWASAPSNSPLEGVINAAALDLDRFTKSESIDPEAIRELSCGRALDVLQGLADAAPARAPRLWLVTRGALATDEKQGAVAVSQSPIWGMARVVAVEFPELNCVCVDLDPAGGSDAGTVFQEVWSGSRETQVAYRGEQRLAARLRRVERSAPNPIGIRKDRTYLITGGLGGLGLKLAQWLVNRGARHLVLTGRRGASGTALASIREMEADGAHVRIIQADISRREDVTAILGQIEAQMPPLSGIFHAAGTLDDGILRQQSRSRFATVMAPKVDGTWRLHELTRNLPLDYFVMFSSAASLVGSPGQGNYAAANAFMDAMAQYRRSLGLPGLSINWGSWAEVGMAAELERREGKSRDIAGVGRIDPLHGFTTLERLMGQNLAQAGVLPIDWAKFFEPFPVGAEPAWLAELVGQRANVPAAEGPPELVKQLESVAPAERRAAVLTYVQKKAAQVLRTSSDRLPDPYRSLNELGVDSLMAVELCNALGRGLGKHLAPTILFSHPTLTALADFIAGDESLGLGAKQEQAVAPATDDLRERALAEAEQLTEDEINALLSISPSVTGADDQERQDRHSATSPVSQ